MSKISGRIDEVARRYAKAYLELVDESGSQKQAEAELAALQKLIETDANFARFVADPLPSRSEQKGAMAAIAKKLKFSDITANMLGVICDNRRVAHLPIILMAIEAGLRTRRGEVIAEVRSARSLNDNQKQEVAKTLTKIIGQNVQLEVTVDQSLLGGLIVKVGSVMLDDSVKTKLQRLTREMKGAA